MATFLGIGNLPLTPNHSWVAILAPDSCRKFLSYITGDTSMLHPVRNKLMKH